MSPRDGAESTLHPRNPHRDGLDFEALMAAEPRLLPFVSLNQWGHQSIDFADPAAVKALNTALLKQVYGVAEWDIPPGYLCPSVPGRADYLHWLADLLAWSNRGEIPRGPAVRVLDLGVGASCVYPLVGVHAYGWSFLGTDVDPVAITSGKRIVAANAHLRRAVELRLQKSAAHLLGGGVLREGEFFDASVCNPPFHSSPQEAQEGSQRKWRNLGKARSHVKGGRAELNFGGQPNELWCEGGERAFIGRHIEESAADPTRCFWFTTLVSKSETLPAIEAALERVRPRVSRVQEMVHGQKTSRIVAWSFLGEAERKKWREQRWK